MSIAGADCRRRAVVRGIEGARRRAPAMSRHKVPERVMNKGRPAESGGREAADSAAARRPKDGVVIAGAPLSGAERWMRVFAPHLPVDCYNPKRLAEGLGRGDEPYIRDRARAILTKLVGRQHPQPAEPGHHQRATQRPVGHRLPGPVARGRLPHPAAAHLLRRGGPGNARAPPQPRRGRPGRAPARHHRPGRAAGRQGRTVELLHNRKGPPLHTHTIQDGAILY